MCTICMYVTHFLLRYFIVVVIVSINASLLISTISNNIIITLYSVAKRAQGLQSGFVRLAGICMWRTVRKDRSMETKLDLKLSEVRER